MTISGGGHDNKSNRRPSFGSWSAKGHGLEAGSRAGEPENPGPQANASGEPVRALGAEPGLFGVPLTLLEAVAPHHRIEAT